MRVIHIVNSLGYGGAERQLAKLSKSAGEIGIEQCVIPLTNVAHEVEMPSSVDVIRVNNGRITSVIAAICHLRRLIRRADDCTYVAWMYHSWLVLLLAGMGLGKGQKFLLYCRHGDIGSLRLLTRFIAIFTLLIAKWRRIRIVFNSKAAMKGHRPWVIGAVMSVIPNGVERISVCGDLPEASNKIGFLGRLHPDKGSDLLALIVPELLRSLPGWEFHAVGKDIPSLSESMNRVARAAGVDSGRIRLQAEISDPNEFLKTLAVLVLPSRTESFPNVLIEAMQAGIPVVAMDVGDVKEILNGHAQVASTIEELIEQTRYICQLSAVDREALGRQMRMISSRYLMDRVVALHVELWRGESRQMALK